MKRMKSHEGYLFVIDSLSKFLEGLELGLEDVRPDFEKVIEKAKSDTENKVVGLPEASFNGKDLSAKIPTNMAAFCGNPKKYENLICYYSIRTFVRSVFWDNDEMLDRACEVWLWELAEYRHRQWKNRLLEFFRIRAFSKDIAVRFSVRFDSGRRIAEEYKSLL